MFFARFSVPLPLSTFSMKYSPAWVRVVRVVLEDNKRPARTHLVAAAYERTTRDIQEAQVLRDLPPTIELRRLDIPINFHVTFRRTHVLAERDHVHIGLAQLYRGREPDPGESNHQTNPSARP